MGGSADEQLYRSEDSESDNDYGDQDQELEELYSGSEDSECYRDSDFDSDDGRGFRDDASDDLSDGERSESCAWAGIAGECHDLAGLSCAQ